VLDLNAVVAGMEPMLRRLIGEDVELVTVPAADLGRVKADPGQVEQVILNLAVNARDAMPKGGRLILQTANGELDEAVAGRHLEARPGRYVKLEVTDTGSGMDATTQARIFEPFFTTKGPGKGTGLGLATVFGIVRQSGGHIWVYSEPEHGTTFKILLPRIDDVDVEPDARSAERDGDGGSETILLVEDDAALRELTAEMLGERGYAVLEAGSPEEALGIAARQAGPIHLLLTDVVMPQMSGRVLASRMAAARPGLQVLYMSGYTDEALGHHGVLAPGMALLQKPFSASGLAHKVRQALDGRSAPDHTAGSATTERGH
jgi:CheY-like chemotaxis protein